MTEPIQVNGWTVYAHPLFLDQVEDLIRQTREAWQKDPQGYSQARCTKLLAATAKLALEDIPRDPSRDAYRQGDTLGSDYRRWYRAKFHQQYRLFFGSSLRLVGKGGTFHAALTHPAACDFKKGFGC